MTSVQNSPGAPTKQVRLSMGSLAEHDNEAETEGPPGILTAIKRRMSLVSSENDSAEKPKGIGLLRRRSTFKSLAQSMTNAFAMRRLTKARIDPSELPKPTVKYENTYKLKPDEGKVFNSCKVRKILTDLLEAHLQDVKYSAEESPGLACDLTNMVKNHMKQMRLPRYKFVCQVILGQCADQALETASRGLWDPSTDNFTCVTYKNDSIFAVVLVHGIYFD